MLSNCRPNTTTLNAVSMLSSPPLVALVGIESLVRRGGVVMPALKYQALDGEFSLPAYIPQDLAKTKAKDLITRCSECNVPVRFVMLLELRVRSYSHAYYWRLGIDMEASGLYLLTCDCISYVFGREELLNLYSPSKDLFW